MMADTSLLLRQGFTLRPLTIEDFFQLEGTSVLPLD